MEAIIYVIGLLVFLGLILVALAYIGLKVKSKERADLEHDKKAIERFVRIQKGKKYKRKLTPKVPTIKK